jgi:hypothetical protein
MHGGYFSQLLSMGNIKMTGSCRLGASPSVIGPYFLNSTMLHSANFCIIDCCIMDYTLLVRSLCTEEDVDQWVDWIVQKSLFEDCQPIFVLIPIDFYADKPFKFFDLYYKIINKRGLFYLDVRDLVRMLCAQTGRPPEVFYADGAHPGDELSTLMAVTLDKFISGYSSIHHEIRDMVAVRKEFRVINLSRSSSDEFERVQYTSSLLDFRGIRLYEGQTCVVQTTPFVRLHAVMINAAKSRKKIRILGSDAVYKNLNVKSYNATASFEGRLVPISGKIADLDGSVTISIANDSVTSESSLLSSETFDGDIDYVEISDLLIEIEIETETLQVTREIRVPVAVSNNIYALVGN